VLAPLAGSGTATLPFSLDQAADSDAFVAPSRVKVQVKDYHGNARCSLTLFDPTDGQALDFATATPGMDTVLLETGGRGSVYLGSDFCGVQVSNQR
jgi:hypothetical protein